MAYNPYAIVQITNYLIDATDSGPVLIGTTAFDKIFTPLYISLEAQSLSSVTGVPTVSVGINESTYNNYLTATIMTGATSDRLTLNYQVAQLNPAAFGGTDIYANITIAALASAYLLRASVIGYYY